MITKHVIGYGVRAEISLKYCRGCRVPVRHGNRLKHDLFGL